MTGLELKALRKLAKLTQAELAELVNCEQYSVSMWEHERAKISRIKEIALKEVLARRIKKLVSEGKFSRAKT